MGTREPGWMSVGELARQTGLTAKALRHYDRVGLLAPIAVSDDGYRWYDESQIDSARTIARLRSLDVPLNAVRAILDGASDADVRNLMSSHRTALRARSDRIVRSLHSLDHLLDDPRGPLMTLKEHAGDSPADERALAAALFGEAWALLERETRTSREDDRMVHVAHASRFHWDNVGDDQSRAIGEWQVSRVYATLGRGEPALFHAGRAVDYASSPECDDWVLASAYEGLARAQAISGDLESARDSRDRALGRLETVTDAEDRAIVAADIDSLPIR